MGMSSFRRMKVQKVRREAYERAMAEQEKKAVTPAVEETASAPEDTEQVAETEVATPVEEEMPTVEELDTAIKAEETAKARTYVENAMNIAKAKKSDAEKIKAKKA